MGKTVGSFVAEFIANVDGLAAGFNKAQDLSSKFSDSIAAGVVKAQLVTAAFEKGLSLASSVLQGATTKAAEFADKIANASERTGVGTETLSAWNIAAQTSDTNFEALTMGAAKMAKSMDANADAFTRLGVQTKDANGQLRPTADVMADVAEKFAKMENGATKAALAQQIFGKSGAELIPFLNQGKAGLQEAAEMAELYGVAVSEKAGAAAKVFHDDLTKQDLAVQGLGNTLSEALMPTLSRIVEAITGVVVSVNQWLRANKPLVDSIIDLGRNIVVVFVDFMARALESVSTLIEYAGKAASAIGMDGLGGVLKTAGDVGHQMALGLKNANDKMGDSFYQTEKLSGATKKLTMDVGESATALEKAAKAHDKVVDAMIKARTESAKLAAATVSDNEKHMEAVEHLEALLQEQKLANDKRTIAELDRQERLRFLMVTAQADLSAAAIKANDETWAAINKTGEKALGDDVKRAQSAVNVVRKEAEDSAASYQKIWEQATANVTSDFVKGFSAVIFHAKNFGDAMKDIAMKTAESMFSAFLTGLLSPLTSSLSSVGRSLAGAISGGGGGGAAGVASSVLGGGGGLGGGALGGALGFGGLAAIGWGAGTLLAHALGIGGPSDDEQWLKANPGGQIYTNGNRLTAAQIAQSHGQPDQTPFAFGSPYGSGGSGGGGNTYNITISTLATDADQAARVIIAAIGRLGRDGTGLEPVYGR